MREWHKVWMANFWIDDSFRWEENSTTERMEDWKEGVGERKRSVETLLLPEGRSERGPFVKVAEAGERSPKAAGLKNIRRSSIGGRGSSTNRPDIVARTARNPTLASPLPRFRFCISNSRRGYAIVIDNFQSDPAAASLPFFFQLSEIRGRDISLRGDVQDFLLRKKWSPLVLPRFFDIFSIFQYFSGRRSKMCNFVVFI